MKIEKQKQNKLVLQYFVVSKPFKIIFTDFFVKNKIWEIHFWRGEPYFFKKINIRSPGDEHAMVLR